MCWLGYRSVGSGRCSPVFHLSLLLCFAVPLPAAFLFSPPGLSHSLALSPRGRSCLSFSRCRSLPRVVVRLFYYFYKYRRHDAAAVAAAATTTTITIRPVAAWRVFPLLVRRGTHCCLRKDANFNLILSNIIYACTRLEEPAGLDFFLPLTLLSLCRFLPFNNSETVGARSSTT